jgi:hypothetical protein
MKRKMVFTEEELNEMGRQTADVIEQSIDAGDRQKAKKLTRRMYREFLAMHDLLRDWVTALLTFIGTEYGDEVLYQALKESCSSWLKPLTELYANKDIRQKVELLAGGLRGHLQPLEIKEDDEKFVLSMHPCGSGGRLVLDGSYRPPRKFMRVKKAQLMTYGRKDFPVYCAHCPFQEILPIEWNGIPLFITVPPAKLGEEPCQMHLYKDPRVIPSELYQRVGKRKP